MHEFKLIHNAFQTWNEICQARNYTNYKWIISQPEKIVNGEEGLISFFDISFQDFFKWFLKQPSSPLPYIELHAQAPSVYHCLKKKETGIIPTITLFSHSDNFNKERNPILGLYHTTPDNVGVGESRELLKQMDNFIAQHIDSTTILHINLLTVGGITSPSLKFLSKFIESKQTPQCQIVFTQFSMTQDLQWNKLNHRLTLPHIICSRFECILLEEEHGIQINAPDVMPQLFVTDAIAQLKAFASGLLIRVDVPLGTVQDTIYRLVTENQAP